MGKAFIVENEKKTNNLAIRLIWIAVGIQFPLCWLLAVTRVFPLKPTNYIMIAGCWALVAIVAMFFNNSKNLWNYTKYVVVFGILFMISVFCAISGNDLTFQTSYLFSVAVSLLYFNPRLTITAGVFVFVFEAVLGIIKPIYINEKLFYPALIAQVLISSALIMAQYFLSLKTNRLFNDLVDKEEREQLLNSLKITLEKLNETFVVLNSSTQQFSASTEEVSQAVSRIADSSGNVFEQIKKANEKSLVIVDTSNELAAFAEEIAANSEQADKIMHDTQEIAVIEEQKVVQFSGKMTAIYDKVAQMYESIKTLEENARKINDINVIIQGITKKTNLLSLNAAIEAARAGEYGKSFAVVAKEIQDLASASANSSENITATLNSIHDQNLSILADLQQSVEVLKNGVEIVQNTGVSLGKIKDSCQSSSGMISEISAGNQREAEAINRITIYLNEISDTIKSISLETEDIASGSEETSASIQEIAASAEQLAVTANGISGIIDTINYKSL